MCGIFGYIGKKKAIPIILQGLKRLEYRGYDSAGIATLVDGKLFISKEMGKISMLEKALSKVEINSTMGIGQTRWATHGKPSKINAHPHLDESGKIALVHNGIIENYAQLKEYLIQKGLSFYSETDTEVIAKLIGYFYRGNLLEATRSALAELKGAFAISLIHVDHPDEMIACCYEAPLVVGIGTKESFIASDKLAISGMSREALILSKGEIAVVKADHVEVYDSSLTIVEKSTEIVEMESLAVSKGNFEHFTLKEIFEQPQTVRQALLGRFDDSFGTAIFDNFNLSSQELLQVERILIVGCGTSLYAGQIGGLLLEEMARIPTQIEIASEYRYKNPVTDKGALVIAISQSGETADTLASVRELKAKGSKIIAICNVDGSTLTREADATLLLRAGPEIGVGSTKAFTSQVIVLSLFALYMARLRHLSKAEGALFLTDLKKLPTQLEEILKRSPDIALLAKKYARFDNFFFIGRSYMYPTALEGALKLKELSYINANGYPAGELKHGPIALVNENLPTFVLATNGATFEKIVSNIQEILARSGPVIAVTSRESDKIKKMVDDLIEIPDNRDALLPILAGCVCQLFAYYVAKERGSDIDQPKNLAKSVTVE